MWPESVVPLPSTIKEDEMEDYAYIKRQLARAIRNFYHHNKSAPSKANQDVIWGLIHAGRIFGIYDMVKTNTEKFL